MLILQKLEDQVEKITGVSAQRAGDIASNETATGAQRAIIQSTNNTKPLFFYHDLVRETVLQEMLELCKVAYADGTQIEFVVDEKTVETIKIDAGMLNGTDLGVFMSNSFEDAENMQKLERYLDVALQTDKANLSDVITVLGSKSLSLIKDTIVAGEREKANRESEAAQAQAENQKQLEQMRIDAEEKQYEFDYYKVDKDYQKAIDVALINQEGRMQDNVEEVVVEEPDLIAERKVTLDERKAAVDERVKAKELQLKERAIQETERSNKAKETIARRRPNATKK
jgi:hypothetical protein